MDTRWSREEELEALDFDDDFGEVSEPGRGRKGRRKVTPRIDQEDVGEGRENKRRRRRWQAPPHKRTSDFEQ